MSKGAGATAVIIFLFVLAFPFFYNIISVGALGAEATAPELKIEKKGECVRDAKWMRHNHMKLLMHTRDDVVREGVRKANHGIQGCRSCHPKRDEFCDRCHEYVGVDPECWHCHYYPE